MSPPMKSSSGGAESAGAMEIAVKFLGWHAFECNAYLAASAQACTCRNSDLAAAIDAALEAARREERGRAVEDCLDILREDQTLYESIQQIRALRALRAHPAQEKP